MEKSTQKKRQDLLSELESIQRKLKWFLDQEGGPSTEDVTLYEASGRWIEAEKARIERAEREQFKAFGNDLEALLKDHNISLKGTYPLLHAGIFSLRLDFATGKCTLSYGPELEKLRERIPLRPEKVMDAIHQEREKLGCSLESEKFVANLARSCERARLETGDNPLRLKDLLPEMAFIIQSDRFRENPTEHAYKEYRRADFSFDLYRHREALGEIRLHVATQSETKKPSNFLWIPHGDAGDGSYYSRISVPERNKEQN